MYILGFLLQVKASGAEGVRMEEAIKINTSLAAFGKGVPLTLPLCFITAQLVPWLGACRGEGRGLWLCETSFDRSAPRIQ